MKRILSILLILIVLCGCTMLISYSIQNEPETSDANARLQPYKAYLIGTPDEANVTDVLQLSEEWIWAGSEYYEVYQDEDAPQTITKEICGKEFTLEYVCTRVLHVLSVNQGNRIFHVYGNPSVHDVQQDAFITVSAKTQQIVAWSDYRDVVDEKGLYKFDPSIPEEAAKAEELSRSHLENLIGKELADQYVAEPGSAGYGFRRYVNGKKTDESIHIVMCADGTLFRYDSFNLGVYEDMTEFVFDEEKGKEVVEEAIQKLYPKGFETIGWSSTLENIPSGQFVYKYNVTVNAVGVGEQFMIFLVAAE